MPARPITAPQAPMDWMLASPLSQPSRLPKRKPQGNLLLPPGSRHGHDGGLAARPSPSRSAVAAMSTTLPSLSGARSPKADVVREMLTPPSEESQSQGVASLSRISSEPILSRRHARPTVMAQRNAALGDPKTEKVLPKLQAKTRPSLMALSPSNEKLVSRELEALGLSREPAAVRAPRASLLFGHGHPHGLGNGAAGLRKPTLGAAMRGVGVPGMEAWTEETNALHEICMIASSVSKELDGVMQRCDAIGDYSASDLHALREIASATHRVREDLLHTTRPHHQHLLQHHHLQEEEPLPSAAPPDKAQVYDDPILAKARKIAALTNKLCDELNVTTMHFGEANRDAAEYDALREISQATKQVCENMRMLQGESWAEGVLRHVFPEHEHREESVKDMASDALSHEPQHQHQHQHQHQFHTERDANGGAGVLGRPLLKRSLTTQGSQEQRPTVKRSSTQAYAPPVSPLAVSVQKVEGLPDLEELLAHSRGHEMGFTEKDIARMQQSFRRFKVPDSSDLHVSDICPLLRYLGHVMTQEEGVRPIIKEVTNFDYVDFDEFLTFMEKYLAYERDQVFKTFEKFDEDHSGSISIKELKAILKELGFIPLHAMVQEALRVVDKNQSGDLDFDEFVVFLALYKRAEGFTQKEVNELRDIFDFFTKHGEYPGQLLPPDELSNGLVQFFGLHVSAFAETLEDQLKAGSVLQSSSYGAVAGGKVDGLRFSEFLIFARKCREEALNKMSGDFPDLSGTGKEDQNEFELHDLDGSGGISEKELRLALKGKGYTVLTQNLEEMLREVDKDRDGELDFGEFFDFMLIFNQREGFGKRQVEEMRHVFNRFDLGHTGEISALELADLFRELGYSKTLDEIHIFVAQVDENESGQLDFREFLRLMRLYREEELANINDVFREYEMNDLLPVPLVPEALDRLEPNVSKDFIAGHTKGQPMDFDSFVGLVDSSRADRVHRERKKAGFPDEKIAELRAMFDRFDRDKGGEIDNVELLGILQEFGWEPKSREEQQALMKKLDSARAKARQAGIKDVGPDGSAAIKFWTFVQLARILETEYAHAEEERLKTLMQELKFSQKEVEAFREIFLAKKHEVAIEYEDSGMVSKLPLKGIPRDAVRRLIKALGVAIVGDKKGQLDEELLQLGCPEDGMLDFFGFLELMRWLMDGWLRPK